MKDYTVSYTLTLRGMERFAAISLPVKADSREAAIVKATQALPKFANTATAWAFYSAEEFTP